MTLVCTLMWCEKPPFVLHACEYIDIDVCKRREECDTVGARTNVCKSVGVCAHICVLVCV